MGVIVRNGNAYGGFDKDFTVVESLASVESPKTEHLYAVGKKLYYHNGTEWIEFNPDTEIPEVKAINAEENQILVGDGDEWTKGSSFKQLNGSFGAGIDVSQNIPVEFGYRDGDDFKYGLQIKAVPNIPKKIRHWSNEFDGPTMVADCGFIEMKTAGAYQEHWTGPNISLRGDCLIDISSTPTAPSYTPLKNEDHQRIRQAFSLPQYPDANFTTTNIPMLKMKDNAIIIMEENSLLQMKNDAIVEVSGAAKVSIDGYYSTKEVGPIASGPDPTEVFIGPGSHIKISGQGETNNQKVAFSSPYFCMEKDHIIMAVFPPNSSTIERKSGGSTEFRVTPIFGDNSMDWTPYLGFGSSSSFNGKQIAAHGTLCDNRTTLCDLTSSWNNKIQNPYVLVQGKTTMEIGDGGALGIKMGPEAGGVLGIDFTPGAGSYTYIKAGSAGGSSTILDLTSKAGSFKHIKFGLDSGAHLDMAVEFGGHSSIKIAPGSHESNFCSGNCHLPTQFAFNLTPVHTDIRAQWHETLCYLESRKSYIKTSDINHIDMSGGLLILRRKKEEIDSLWRAYADTNTYTYQTKTDYNSISAFLADTNRNGENIDAFNTDFGQGLFTRYKRIVNASVNSAPSDGYEDMYQITISKVICDGDTVINSSTSVNSYTTWSQVQGNSSYTYVANKEGMTKKDTSTFSVSGYKIQLNDMHFTKKSFTVKGLKNLYHTTTATSFADLNAEDQAIIQADLENQGFTNIDFSTAQLSSSSIRSDMRYDTTISNIQYYTNSPMAHDYSGVVQPTGDYEGLPILQLCGKSSILMGDYIYSDDTFYESQEDLPLSGDYVDVTAFKQSTVYSTFMTDLKQNNRSLISLGSISKSSGSTANTYKYSYSYVYRQHMIARDNPIIDIQGKSTLQLENFNIKGYIGEKGPAVELGYEGATLLQLENFNIKGYIGENGPTVEFGYGGTSVSFTIDELQRLKALLS